MKLSQGEYVALEKIENMYGTCPIVLQLYVHGDSLQDHLIGIMVPEPAMLADLVSRVTHKKIDAENAEALKQASEDPKVRKAIQQALDKQAKQNGLKGCVTFYLEKGC